MMRVDSEQLQDTRVAFEPSELSKLVEAKTAIQAAYGQVILAMSSVPRYRHQSLSDLSHLVVDPLFHDCIAIATPRDADNDGVLTPAAIAIWASVSEEVELKIQEQIKASVFPLRLKSSDWKSGDRVWLLDIVSPSRGLATEVLKSFSRIAGTQTVNIHPIVVGLVDPKIIEELRSNDPEVRPINNS